MSRVRRALGRGAYLVVVAVGWLGGCGGATDEGQGDAGAVSADQGPDGAEGTRLDGGVTIDTPDGGGIVPVPTTTACDTATGRVLSVGPGMTYPVPSAAAAVAKAGDVIAIKAGDYTGDVATWSASNLTLCGIGGRARLFAGGKDAQGKAIWVISGANVVVDSVEFHDVTVPDQNGAGIRAEGGDLTVINCGFFDSDEGILGGDGANVKIDRSEFGRNGYGDGQSHNLYIGFAKSLTVTASYFHEAKSGHNLKSRAAVTRVENCYLMDGPEGTSSYLADFPAGGAVFLRGNLFHKGPMAENSTAISFAAESMSWPVNTLELTHNTVVMTRSGGAFLSAPAATQSVKLTANLFAGTDVPALLVDGFPVSSVMQSNNVTSTAGNVPGADDLANPNFWPSPALLGQLALSIVPDPGFLADAPHPLVLRAVMGPARKIGALQAQP